MFKGLRYILFVRSVFIFLFGCIFLFEINSLGAMQRPDSIVKGLSGKWKVPLEYIDVCENAEPIKIEISLNGKSFFEDYFAFKDYMAQKHNIAVRWGQKDKTGVVFLDDIKRNEIMITKKYSGNYALVVQDMKVDIEQEYYPIMLYSLPQIDIADVHFEAGDNNHIQSFDSAFGKSVLTVGQIKRTHAHQLSGKLKLLLIDKWSSLSKTLLLNKAESLTVAGNHYEVRLLDIRQIDNYQLAGKSIAEKMFKGSQGVDNMNDVTVVQVQISSEAYPELWSIQDIGLEYGEKVIHPFEYSINSGDKESKTIELVFPQIEGTELKLHLKFPEVFSEQVIDF